VQRQTAEAWLAFAEGRRDEALRMLSSAADLEDSMDKSPVTPGPIVPAREMLGDLLLQMGSADLALQAFKRSLEGSPNRLNALSGAARAAQLTGDRAAAAAYYEQVSKLLGTAR
jgi:tetratricopeptide (TPR) repeat protein